MYKKILSVVLMVCVLATLVTTPRAEDGLALNNKGLGLSAGKFGGAFIKVSDAGLEVGKSYTIEYVVYAIGTTGFRVRYTDNDGSEGIFKYNDESTGAHSAPSAIANGTTASQIPAYFENTIDPNMTKLLTVKFTFGKKIDGLDPLTMDYIGFFGARGGDSYEVLGMRLKDASGKEISSVGDMNPSATPAPSKAPSEDSGKYTRENFFTLVQDGSTKYQLHRPAEPEKGKKYPILISLHGSGNHDFVEAYPKKGSVGLIEDFIDDVNEDPKQYESYVVMTVTPGWGPAPQTVKSIIDKLVKEEAADPDRVYIYGVSMGGFATSDFIMTYPDTAAAAVLICGASDLSSANAKKLVDLPLRLYHSDDDPTVGVGASRSFYNKLLGEGAKNAEYFELTGYGHTAWLYAYKSDMVEWMFKQSKNLSASPSPSPAPSPTPSKEAPNLATAATWAQAGIQSAYTKGFIPTDIQGSYGKAITRAEFCRMAVQWLEYVMGKNIDAILTEQGKSRNTNAFDDTKDTYILAAYALGITSGTVAPTATTPGKFSPNSDFTRQEAAAMVRNVCKAYGANVSQAPDQGFTDLGAAARWAVDGINFCKANGIMSGTGTTSPKFSPASPYTRQESILTFDNIKPETLPK